MHFPLLERMHRSFESGDRVLESIKAGKRLSESRFSNLNTGGCGQGSVLGLLMRKDDADADGMGLPGAETGK